ncbi:conjugal transfer ATP-binding protein TraC [Pseudomonas duriflava]|uniref:Conjugal transfer ATP-binding protein TraC n=1 Tax=Pseudomonas duriflava TaxID=459528 RepID=A0A562PSH1_9PSED|nr:type IV secretion system protein TraC [Pseudomonas duriflava]TWI47100.1 conjugal transfer ATP-binding protein TraC [Pseudomonas duriflava]
MEFISVREEYAEGIIPREVRASQLSPVIAYDEEKEYFFNNDGTIGVGFMCRPLPGADQGLQDRINNMLNQAFPNDTIISFLLFLSPEIEASLGSMEQLRENFHHPLLSEIVKNRVSFLNHHTREPMISRGRKGYFNNGVIHDQKLVITLKIPIKDRLPGKKELEELFTAAEKLESSLNNIGFAPRKLDADLLKRTMTTLLNWGERSSWRLGEETWDETSPINEQIFDYDTDVEVKKTHLRMGDTYAKILSAKRLPKTMFFGDAIGYVGDLSGQGQSIKENYAICCNVYYPNAQKQKKNLDRKRTLTVNQAFGPLLKIVPVLGEKKESFDTLEKSMSAGNRPLRMNYSVMIFAPTLKRVEAAATAFQDIWAESKFTMMQDKFIQMPMLINSLPFGADHKAVVELNRYKTLTSEHATVLLPLFGEWKGTGTPHVGLVSRNGQFMSLSLHDSETNKNGVIAAESGSGKSFFANEFLTAYMSEGAHVWVIDAGRSYEKLCDTLEGSYVQFGESSTICLNPFDIVVDYEEDEDALVSQVMAMASPKGNLEEFQIAETRRLMANIWRHKGNAMLVDDIAEACLAHPDQRVKDVGSQLYVFTKDGSYGKYFHGRNNMQFTNQFTVLELDELQGRKHLRQIVLLQLIYQIQQAVYHGDRNVKKIVFIDEAWDLLKEGDTSVFMEHAYRKFRKYQGSVLIATQSINDLYENPVGRSIAENSAFMFLLGQTSETVESVRRSGRLTLSEGGFSLLKTVHTVAGVYSEIFIRSKTGVGVGRLIVGPFQKLLYSTDPNDVGQIDRYRAMGLSVTDAIYAVMRDRGELASKVDEEAIELADSHTRLLRSNRPRDSAPQTGPRLVPLTLPEEPEATAEASAAKPVSTPTTATAEEEVTP